MRVGAHVREKSTSTDIYDGNCVIYNHKKGYLNFDRLTPLIKKHQRETEQVVFSLVDVLYLYCLLSPLAVVYCWMRIV